MSGECDRCGEHALECTCISIVVCKVCLNKIGNKDPEFNVKINVGDKINCWMCGKINLNI